MAQSIWVGLCIALALLLNGCGFGPSPKKSKKGKVCCLQCGGATVAQNLVCQVASYNGDGSCDMKEVLDGMSGDVKDSCSSAHTPYEQVGTETTEGAQAYGPQAVHYWADGHTVEDRAQAWKHTVDSDDLHSFFGNNSLKTTSEIVAAHKANLVDQGLNVVFRGAVSHPLAEELKGFWDFLSAVVDLLQVVVEGVADLCTGDMKSAEECLAIVGLPLAVETATLVQNSTVV